MAEKNRSIYDLLISSIGTIKEIKMALSVYIGGWWGFLIWEDEYIFEDFQLHTHSILEMKC